MATQKNNQEDCPKKAIRQFLDALLRGEQPDVEELVRQYPEFEHQIRQKVERFQKVDSLFDTLVQADESDFADAVTEPGLVGQKIGNFEIAEMIGRGGMGVVYLARDTKLKRSVAIKSIPAALAADSTARTRFRREAELLASLNHPNIAVIHEIIEEEKSGYLVLEYVPGQTLAERIAKGPLKLQEALTIALQIAEAVAAAHEHDVIHRDLKPGNIKITPDGRVKVLDFGLAKASTSEAVTEETTVTQPGRVMGTPAYMSPEQACGKSTDRRTDIWSFGCVLYEMLTGQTPFKGATTSETLVNILEHDPEWQDLSQMIHEDVVSILQRCLEKDPNRRFQSAEELRQELLDCQYTLIASPSKAVDPKALLQWLRRPRIAIGVSLVVLMIGISAYLLFNRMAKVRWAKGVLPEIERLVDKDKYLDAFCIARNAEKYIATDPALIKLWPAITRDFSVITRPSGAEVFYKEYSKVEQEWLYLGRSPLENIRFPRGIYRWKFEKAGYVRRECAGDTSLNIKLWEEHTNPVDMVLVSPGRVKIHTYTFFGYEEPVVIGQFWIDKYEVTNEEFKAFVDNGGYQKQEYWKHKFLKEGREISWKRAMGEFKDTTGRTGPSTWKGGTYLEGQEKYPACGISWYEAAAYAEFMGKDLPTIYQWQKAACLNQRQLITPLSNVETEEPAKVGSHPGMGSTGVYDMAGNVKEWCANSTDESGRLRYILGGGWNEPAYMFAAWDCRSPWNRSLSNGLRCVKYSDGRRGDHAIPYRPVEASLNRDYSKETPISDEEFQAYRQLYKYDPTDLKEDVESVDDSPVYWHREKITFDAGYGGERVSAYLFLPKGVKPPYQAVVYFPGGNSIHDRNRSFENIEPRVSVIIMSGRSLMWPIYKGTFDRGHPEGQFPDYGRPNARREWIRQIAKDLCRSIDYLETRDDIDDEKIAYYGTSWGAAMAPIMLAVESRLKTGVFFLGGFWPVRQPPSADPLNFAPRVTVPILMINGREDASFPLETSQLPMFNSFGTEDKYKKHILYPGGHDIYQSYALEIGEDIRSWLDLYLGPVE